MESAVQTSLHESYDNWMAVDADKEYTAGGNMGAPARRILEARVLKAWNMLDTERVKNSLKVFVCVCVPACVRACVCVFSDGRGH